MAEKYMTLVKLDGVFQETGHEHETAGEAIRFAQAEVGLDWVVVKVVAASDPPLVEADGSKSIGVHCCDRSFATAGEAIQHEKQHGIWEDCTPEQLAVFVASREEVKDLSTKQVPASCGITPGVGGMVYCDGQLWMEDAHTWNNGKWSDPKRTDPLPRWYLMLCNDEHMSDDLGDLERILCDYAIREGFLDAVKGGA